jgi:hypothetical protein
MLQSVKCVSTTTLGEDRPTGRLQQTDMSQPHDDLGRLDTRVFPVWLFYPIAVSTSRVKDQRRNPMTILLMRRSIGNDRSDPHTWSVWLIVLVTSTVGNARL